jgi:Lysozyme inhibitor LprI
MVCRLSLVFIVWMASTAFAVDPAEPDYDAELHEAYAAAWDRADERARELLARAQRGWNEYRSATCRSRGEDCWGFMAQERAAELRRLTETNVRTILPAHARNPDQR